jgi:hypothetical protein
MHIMTALIALTLAAVPQTWVMSGPGAAATAGPQMTPQMYLQSESNRENPSRVGDAKSPERGLQDGWAIDNACGVMFTPEVATAIADAGATWARINFRLGASQTWTETATCKGISALDLYDTAVDNARAAGLEVLGLLSNESWPGSQAEWQANSAERNPWSSGNNDYLVAFSKNAGSVLFEHFAGRVAAWEVWNEPNAYTSYSPDAGYTGSTFIYPSNFAWLLRHVYEEAEASGVTGIVIVSGGVFGHDLTATLAPWGTGVEHKRGDPQTPGYIVPGGTKPSLSLSADPIALKSGADYLRATYSQGIALAGWDLLRLLYARYPLDGIGQHVYVDQGSSTTSAKIEGYLGAVRAVALEHPEVAPPPTWITEIGWTTASVSPAIQAANLNAAFNTFEAVAYVDSAFWFQLRDIAAAGMYYGLLTPFDPPWTRRPAWGAFHPPQVFIPMLLAGPGLQWRANRL